MLPSTEPPATVTVLISAEAVPATWGTGVIASELAIGDRPCTSGMTAAVARQNTQNGGWPPVASDTTSITTVVATPSRAMRRTSRSAPIRPTRRALFNELTASSTAIAPK